MLSKHTVKCSSCRLSVLRSAAVPVALKNGPRAGETYWVCSDCYERREQRKAAKALRPGPNPLGLCECGCGELAPIASKTRNHLGHIKGKPVRFIPGHVARALNKPAPRQIDPTRFTVDPSTGCWNWSKARNANGYGIIGSGGSCYLAHRMYYELAKGPIPDNKPLDHLCRNRVCVNPDHLEPVTNSTNSRRGAATRLSMDKARAIRALRGAMPASQVARLYDVTEGNIYAIWHNRTWRE